MPASAAGTPIATPRAITVSVSRSAEPAHVAAAGAERQAQAEFGAAARDTVGHHAV